MRAARLRSLAAALSLTAGLLAACASDPVTNAEVIPHTTAPTAGTVTALPRPTSAATTSTSTTTSSPTSTSTSTISTTTSTTSTTSTTTSTTTSSTSTTSTTAPPAPATFDGDTAAFDQVIQAATIGYGDDAVAAAILVDGEVVHEFAAGTENPLLGTSVTPASRFRLASISKVLATTVVMQLVEEGRIELDEPLLDQFTTDALILDPRTRSITIRQLLSHTSGLQKAWTRFFDHGANSWQEAATLALGDELLGQPGSVFQYSNANFAVLGLLVEQVTGEPYEQVVNERVLTPLGITEMRMAGTFDVQFGDVVHRSTPGRNYMETLGPAGAWIGSATDTARIVAALAGDGLVPVLSPDTVAQMRQPQIVLPPALGWNYGLGLRLFADGSWGHTGTVEKTRAVAINRSGGLTVAVMVSGDVPWTTDDLLTTIDAALAAS